MPPIHPSAYPKKPTYGRALPEGVLPGQVPVWDPGLQEYVPADTQALDVALERRLRAQLTGGLMTIWGHSMTFSDIMSQAGARWPDRLKNRLDLGWMLELGQNGSSVHDIANYIAGGGYGNRQWQQWRGVHLVQTGAIELLFENDGATLRNGSDLSDRQKKSIEENLRAIFATFDGPGSGGRDEITDTSGWTLNGTWGSSNSAGSSLGSHRFTSIPGDYAEKVLAAGTYWVHFLSGIPAGLPFGTIDISVGGVVIHDNVDTEVSWDAGGSQSLEFGRMARKIVVPAGDAAARTVRITHSGPPATYVVPDFVALVGAWQPLAYAVKEFWTGNKVGPDPLIDAELAQASYSAVFDAVMSEFPQYGVLDIGEGWEYAKHVGTDGIHPNDAGQMLFADNLIRELGQALPEGFLPRMHLGEGVTTAVQSGARLWENKTGSFTFELLHRDFTVKQTAGGATNASIPNQPDWPTGTIWEVMQYGAGQVTIVGLSGTTLRAPSGLRIKAQYGKATIEKIGPSEYLVTGDLMV